MTKTERLPEIDSFIRTRWEAKRVRYNQEALSPEMRRIVERLTQRTQTWNPVEIYTPNPKNLKAEKEAFLAAHKAGEEYTPTLEYDFAQQMDIGDAHDELMSLLHEVRQHQPRNEQERLFRIALAAKVRDDLATIDIVNGIKGKDETITRRGMNQKYPANDASLSAFAHRAYEHMISAPRKDLPPKPALLNEQQQEQLRAMSCDASHIKAAFEWLLEKNGLLRTEENKIGLQCRDR